MEEAGIFDELYVRRLTPLIPLKTRGITLVGLLVVLPATGSPNLRG